MSNTVWQTPGWLNKVFASNGWLWFGIDREQKMRQLGMPTDIGTDVAKLKFFTHEVRYFNFEAQRKARLDAEEDVTIVPVFENQSVKNEKVMVNFPSAKSCLNLIQWRSMSPIIAQSISIAIVENGIINPNSIL